MKLNIETNKIYIILATIKFIVKSTPNPTFKKFRNMYLYCVCAQCNY